MKTTLGTHFFLRWLDWLARRMAWAAMTYSHPVRWQRYRSHAHAINRWIREDYRRWQQLTFEKEAA